MNVFVRLNGTLAQAVGASRMILPLSEPATIQDLFDTLIEKHPNAADQIRRAIPVVNGVHQSKSTSLSASQEIALLMPIAGG